MADGFGITVPFDGAGFAKIDQARKAVRELTKEINQATREIKKAAATPAYQSLLKDKRASSEALRTELKGQIESVTKSNQQLATARTEERIGLKFQRVFGGSFAQKLIRGEALDATDLLREARGAEKLVERGLKAIGVKSPGLGMLGVGLMVGTEAVEAWSRALEQIKKEKQEAQKVGSDFGRGRMSQAEFDLFQNQFNTIAHGGSAAAGLKQLQQAAAGLDEIRGAKLATILDHDNQAKRIMNEIPDATRATMSPLVKAGIQASIEKNLKNLPSAAKVEGAIDAAISAKEQQLGGVLNKETRQAVFREVLATELKDLGPEARDAITEQIIKAEEDAYANKQDAKRQRPVWMEYAERRTKEIYQMNLDLMDKRVPSTPYD